MGSSSPACRGAHPTTEPVARVLDLPENSTGAREVINDLPPGTSPSRNSAQKQSSQSDKEDSALKIISQALEPSFNPSGNVLKSDASGFISNVQNVSVVNKVKGVDVLGEQALTPTAQVLDAKAANPRVDAPVTSGKLKDQLVQNIEEQENSPVKMFPVFKTSSEPVVVDKLIARSPVARIPRSLTENSDGESEQVNQGGNSANKLTPVDSPVVFSVEKLPGRSKDAGKKDGLRSFEAREGKDVMEQKVVVSGIGNVEVKPGLTERESVEQTVEGKKEVNNNDDKDMDIPLSKRKKRRLSARALRWKRRSKRKESSDIDDSDFVMSDTEETVETSEATGPVSYSDSTNSFKRRRDLREMAKENRSKHIPRRAEVKVWKYGRIVWAKIGKYGYWPAMVVTPDSYLWLKKDHSKRRPRNTVTVHFFADGCLADVRMQDVHDFDTNRHLQADEGEDEFASEIEAARIAADLVLKKYGHSYPRKLDRTEEEEILDGSGIHQHKIVASEGVNENPSPTNVVQAQNKTGLGEGGNAAQVSAMKEMIRRLRAQNANLKQDNKEQKEKNVKLQETLNQIRGLMK